jgi:hypothetical protein
MIIFGKGHREERRTKRKRMKFEKGRKKKERQKDENKASIDQVSTPSHLVIPPKSGEPN